MKAICQRFRTAELQARREAGVRRTEPVSFCAHREVVTENSCVDLPLSFRHSE